VKALIVAPEAPGGIRFVTDHPAPTPATGEVRIRVDLAGICATDLEIARGYMQFAGVPGHEFVGTVIDGPDNLRNRRVVAEINCPCGTCPACKRGLGNHCPTRTVVGIAGRDGAFAEQLTVPAANCHVVPDAVSDAAAVFVEPLAAAAHVLDDLPAPHDALRVAVLGTGRLGLLTAAVLAAADGRVTAIGRNPRTLALARQWGLPTAATDALEEAAFDAVVDCTGHPDGLRMAMALCRPRGTIVLKSTYAAAAALNPAPVVIHEQRIIGSRCGAFGPALELLAAGRVPVTDLITATYPLSDGVAAMQTAAEREHIKVLLRPRS
jgi:2-desacetyl-2-hydroxyethyl bacteriochlorophyllide A dehydrogenase